MSITKKNIVARIDSTTEYSLRDNSRKILSIATTLHKNGLKPKKFGTLYNNEKLKQVLTLSEKDIVSNGFITFSELDFVNNKDKIVNLLKTNKINILKEQKIDDTIYLIIDFNNVI